MSPSAEEPRRVRLAVVGCGNRGQAYSDWAREHPERVDIVAVADPIHEARAKVGRGFDPEQFDDWQRCLAAIDRGELEVDAVLIVTQDRDHVAPTIMAARLGLAILVEKPLAPTLEECELLAWVIRESGVLFAVGHVMRYTPYSAMVRQIVESGALGSVTSVQHLEPVGWWHMAHSYVRGNWRSEEIAAPMLLAKSCHDLDWLMYVTGKEIARVSSFGRLSHFVPEAAPAEAAERCLDCAVERACPYSAIKIYLEPAQRSGVVAWPASVITQGTQTEDVHTALREGPYGRCVYRCDNDVVDHQTVAIEFTDGATASFVMAGHTPHGGRQTQIFGSHGALSGDGEKVTLTDFRDGETHHYSTSEIAGHDAAHGHGGGDHGLMASFIEAVATNNPDHIKSDIESTLLSHAAVFAAERSRHTRTVQCARTNSSKTPAGKERR